MFVDEVEIHVAAGSGGRGCLAFRREKFVPRGGPSGGDGGHGGSVYLVASPHINTLINFRFHPEFDAPRGQHGMGSNCTGHGGADLELAVPIGTLVLEKVPENVDEETAGDSPYRLVADLSTEGQRVLVAKGGRGGMGNARFATATNRAPRKVQPGEPGEIKDLRLELKLLADVGLVGFPNAGKSTMIARISAARPKSGRPGWGCRSCACPASAVRACPSCWKPCGRGWPLRANRPPERMKSPARRIGILGGTFDPIHWGHLDLGDVAVSQLELSRLFVITSNVPPHRPQPLASSYHRFAMVSQALLDRPDWRAPRLELRPQAPSFTSRTFELFHERGYLS